MKRILLAYDGSEPATKALTFALDLAQKYAGEIKVLAVARPPEFAEEVETSAALESARQQAWRILQPLREELAAHGIPHSVEVAVGHPAEKIVRRAEEWEATLIVMGHRGRGVMGRWLLGSVAKAVMHHAPCAVLIVR